MRSFARTVGATFFGAQARLVDIQVVACWEEEESLLPPFRLGQGAVFRMVGLPDSAAREGRERIRGAVLHGRWPWPNLAVTVNLAPAAARKEGAALDLPIAIGVLEARGVLGAGRRLRRWLCLGELGLDGCVRPVRGVLAAAEAARRGGVKRALVPRANAGEASAVAGLQVVAVEHLADAVGHLTGVRELRVETPRPWRPDREDRSQPLPVRGQAIAVRAAGVAAAGRHNLLLTGPPGAGKTLLARQVARWMVPLAYEEALAASRIHSVAGLLPDGLLTRRPFRAPHHSTSLAGLVGGGPMLRPGELSLAHLGVLFLDELAEFTRPSLEALRQPLESGELVVGRAAGHATFPADVLLVAATNPCPCGWHGVEDRCRCGARVVARYQRRISGPLRDRFDLHVQVDPVDVAALVGPREEEGASGAWSIEALDRAGRRQRKRAEALGFAGAANARIPGHLLPGAVEPTRDAESLLVRSARKLGLTGRGVHRLLRVSRTLADLEGAESVEARHVGEAVTHRGA